MYSTLITIRYFLVFGLTLLAAARVIAQSPGESRSIGRWDLEVEYENRWVPYWLEVKLSGDRALVGHFVGRSGSARPIAEVFDKDGLISFSIPPQWNGTVYMHFTGTIKGDSLEGNILDHMGNARAFR